MSLLFTLVIILVVINLADRQIEISTTTITLPDFQHFRREEENVDEERKS